MSESTFYLGAFAHDWQQSTLEARLAAVASTIARSGWNAVRIEIAAGGDVAHAEIGVVPVRDGGAGARRMLLGAVSRFAAYGAFVVPAAARPDVAPIIREGSADVVVVPLAAHGEPIGTIVTVGTATEANVTALRALADIVAVAADADRRLMRAEADAARAAVIARVGESIRSSLDREEILRAVARDMREAFHCMRAAMYVRDERNPNLARVVASDDPFGTAPPSPAQLPIAGSLLNKCLGLGQVVRIERGASSTESAQLAPFGAASLLLVPFVVGGRIDAALSVQFAQEHVFDDRDLVLMRTIAMHVGLALANSRLYERERSARRRAEDVEQNVLALKESRNGTEILKLLLDMIGREYELSGSAWSHEAGRLVCRVLTDRTTRFPELGDEAPDALAVIETLADQDIISIAARDDGAWYPVVGARGGFALPLRVDGRLLAVLVFDGIPRRTSDAHGFDAYLRTVAAHGSLALANAQAFAAERRFALESAAISDAGREILGHNKLEPLAESMCTFARGLAVADRASLYVPREGVLHNVLAASSSEPEVLAFDDPLVRDALALGTASATSGAESATLVVPLRPVAGDTAGVLIVARLGRDAPAFDRATIRQVEALGALVALGLRNVDLYRALAENNEFKDDLLAMFTHDFKGPLTVIQGYTELLMEDDLGPASAHINTIHRQSIRLAKLAEDALVLARTQAAGFSLQRAVCDLNGFVAESVDAHDPAGVRIAFSAPEAPMLVSIDRTRIKHVLDNVISNALKYSAEVVQVDVVPSDRDVVVRVVDRGIGIPAADLERIFVRFGRGTNARSLGISGTGVGLYVARKILDVHGGRIAVTSRENHGSTFEITLPRVVAPAAPALPSLAAQ